MKLSEALNLKKKDVVSIVGAGGKTSLMLQLARELRSQRKVLVTTTTKIYIPSDKDYDFLCCSYENYEKHMLKKTEGIYVLGKGLSEENKLMGLSEEELSKTCHNFDYTLIEADGAKRKSLKGWNRYEPVIYSGTTKTIGVLDITSVGIEIKEDNIHRSDRFCNITDSNSGGFVNLEHLVKLVLHPEGLFKNSLGEDILYINKVESDIDLERTQGLIEQIMMLSEGRLNKFVYGSIFENIYK
jgi:probable selenium-dependent hydroxylase accessory protein YqeC